MRLSERLKHEAKRILSGVMGERKQSPSGVILMYHRIGCGNPDPWELFVSKENFRQQLDILKGSFQVHLLSDLDFVLQDKKKGKRNVFITFDDGCSDNFETAFPLLRECALPATFFIPTGGLNGQTVFWWEILDYIFWKKDRLPERIELGSGKNKFDKVLTPEMQMREPDQESAWSANRDPAPTPRCGLYLEISNWIRIQGPHEQKKIAGQMIGLYGDDDLQQDNFFKKMSLEQIAFLSKNEFEIGGHTIHHPSLKFHDYPLQQEEIEGNLLLLKEITGKDIVSFAYPHGEYNENTLAIMEACGINYACTTDCGAVYTKTNKLALPRMLVENMNGSIFKGKLESLFIPS